VFVKLAFFNLLRHRRRTLLILFAVAVSVFVMNLVAALMGGMRYHFLSSIVSGGGHITLYADGWKERTDSYSLAPVISDPGNLIITLEEDPRIAGAENVMEFTALLISGSKNIALSGLGIPAETAAWSQVKNAMQQGSFPPMKDGIVISRTVAQTLSLQVGDAVTVLVQDSGESPFYLDFTVSGIFSSSSTEFDEGTFFIPFSDARQLLYLPDKTTEIRIRLHDPYQAAAVVSSYNRLFTDNHLEAETWQQANGSLLEMLNMFDFFMAIVNVFIMIVAVSVIINTVLMNVFDRIREFGTLRAVGLKKKAMSLILLIEGLITGVGGSIAGFLFSYPVILYFGTYGLNWGEFSDLIGAGDSVYFRLSALRCLTNILSGITVTLLASAYAAWSGRRKTIVESLKTV
jgi:putative ABC transport system permease protein